MSKGYGRIIVMVMLTLWLCTLSLLGAAAAKKDWQNAGGCYVWTESSQFNNGVLNIKPLGDDQYLYELKVMRGSEAEDSAEDFVTAGVFTVNEDGDGIAEVEYKGNDTVELRFVYKDKTVEAYQDGPLPLDVQGEYKFQEAGFDVSEAAATAMLAGLPQEQTGLQADKAEYNLFFADETVDGWFYQLLAVKDNQIIGRYLVAADLSAVYRNDAEDEPNLIYGTPENMLAAKKAPLVEEEIQDGPAIESGELEGNTDEEDLPTNAASELSPLVTVQPEQEEDTIDLLELFMGLLAHWQLIAAESKRTGDMLNSRKLFDDSETAHPLQEEEMIPVERIQGKLLLIGAEDDVLWDAAKYIRRMEKRLSEKPHSCSVEAAVYAHGTHFVFPEGMLKTMLPVGSGLFVKWAFPAARKYPKECRETRLDVERRVCRALTEWKGEK